MQKAFGSGQPPGTQKYPFNLGPDSLASKPNPNETKRQNLKDFQNTPLAKTILSNQSAATSLVQQLPENQIARLLLLKDVVLANQDIRESLNSSISLSKRGARASLDFGGKARSPSPVPPSEGGLSPMLQKKRML